MIVDVAGRGQCRDVTAVHGTVIGQAQGRLPGLIANRLPPLVGLHPANWGDPNPAMVGVGVGHHPVWPVEQHQAGTPFGLDEPRPARRLRRHLRDQRTEILLVSGQFHQEPADLIHIDDVARTQFIELSQEVAQRAGESACAHPSDSTARHWRGHHPPGVSAPGRAGHQRSRGPAGAGRAAPAIVESRRPRAGSRLAPGPEHAGSRSRLANDATPEDRSSVRANSGTNAQTNLRLRGGRPHQP